MDSIRVVIADDNEGMRLIEAKLIALAEGFDLAGEAADGEALLREMKSVIPDAAMIGYVTEREEKAIVIEA